MEIALSAVAGELASRFLNFAVKKYYSSRYSCLEENVESLQNLLTRVHAIVEEADARYVTNTRMLMQLQTLSGVMYRGYHVLDTFKFHLYDESIVNKVRDSHDVSSATPSKRPPRILASPNKGKVLQREIHDALKCLETIISNMAEFVALLGCCGRISCKPYDTYLYIDNFMFGRHTEKQTLLNFLLRCNHPCDPPAVLPIIGGLAVGKKTLVAHVCNDERVRSYFSSVFQLNGENYLKFVDCEPSMLGKKLIVVEFAADVDDQDWKKFYSFVAGMSSGSKVIIISKIERLTRFGSVKPILLNRLSYEEFWYFFKILAFGSTNPMECPQLVPIAEAFAKEVQLGESLVAANAFADVLRTNMDAKVWLGILNRYRRVIERNIRIYGEHPKLRFMQGRRVDITDFALNSASAIRIKPSGTCGSKTHVHLKKELPQIKLRELLLEPYVIRPKGDFNLLTWESKIPPYTSFLQFVPCCDPNIPDGTLSVGKKRRGVPL